MARFDKVLGVGLSKTGLTTLKDCLRLLKLGPHRRSDTQLHTLLISGEVPIPFLRRYMSLFYSFDNIPWNRLYREVDEWFPNTGFILTVRRDAKTRAESAWRHSVRQGHIKGRLSRPEPDFIERKMRAYETQVAAVRDYFQGRPNFIELCWETGHGWKELCEFLHVPIPKEPFPHRLDSRAKEWPN